MNAPPNVVPLKTSSPRVIRIEAGELPRHVREAEEALNRPGIGIYQRAGQLVRIAQLERDTHANGVRRKAGSVIIAPVTRDYLTLKLAEEADWEKFDRRGGAFRRVDPPPNVAAAMLSKVGEWPFAHLTGIATAPTLRADGSLLAQPGFDAASGIFLAIEPDEFPAIDPRPSRDDAMGALDVLEDLFSECAFAGGLRSAHASVTVAATITACVRHALPTAPAFGISAHKPGSGKTTVARAVAHVCVGRDAPVISPTDDEAEFRKALLAILIAGDAVVLIDNVVKPVDSAALCAVLTAATYRDRVLGVSQQITVPTAATWLMTGNSLEFVGDLTSRALLSVLDPECEHPEARPFRRNLGDYVLAHRGDLIRAALTIPLAYRAAGSPGVLATRSRFEEWDAFVRRPLIWLGAEDPLDTQAELRASDPVREALVAALNAWEAEFGDTPASVAMAVEVASGTGFSEKGQLRDALLEVAGERNGAINSRRLGRYLVRYLRRIEGGKRFEDAGSDRLSCRRLFKVHRVSSVSSVSSNPSREKQESEGVGIETNAGNAGNAGREFA